jgi:hypothetical protein
MYVVCKDPVHPHRQDSLLPVEMPVFEFCVGKYCVKHINALRSKKIRNFDMKLGSSHSNH